MRKGVKRLEQNSRLEQNLQKLQIAKKPIEAWVRNIIPQKYI